MARNSFSLLLKIYFKRNLYLTIMNFNEATKKYIYIHIYVWTK